MNRVAPAPHPKKAMIKNGYPKMKALSRAAIMCAPTSHGESAVHWKHLVRMVQLSADRFILWEQARMVQTLQFHTHMIAHPLCMVGPRNTQSI